MCAEARCFWFRTKSNESAPQLIVLTQREGQMIFNFELGLRIDNEILIVSHCEQELPVSGKRCCSVNMLCLLIQSFISVCEDFLLFSLIK